jgi:hypothetical protein
VNNSQTRSQKNLIKSLATRSKSNLLVVTVVFSLFAFTQTLILDSRFGSNDDFVMSQIANGGFTGETSKYLLFCNILIGHALVFFYQILPSVQWYPLLQILSMSFAFAVFVRSGIFKLSFLNLGSKSVRLLFALVLFVVTCSQFMVWVFSINYSTTAYFCSAIGCLAMLLSIRVNPSSLAVAPILVCFLGYLWRPQAFISVLPIFLLVLLSQIRIASVKSIFRNVSFLALCVLFASFFDRNTYTSSAKWKDFYFYDSLRGKVHGNSVFNSLKEQIGVPEIAKIMKTPEINLSLFGQWFYSTSTTTTESLAHAVRLISENTVISELRLGKIALSQAVGVFLVIAPLTMFVLFFKSKRKAPLFLTISLIFILMIFAESYLEQFIRLPGYVIEGLRFSAILGSLGLLVLAPPNGSDAIDKKWSSRFFLLFSFLPFVLYANHLIGVLPNNSSSSTKIHDQFIADTRVLQQSLSIATIDLTESIDPSVLSPWSNFKLTSLPLIPVGWITSSPTANERLNYFKVFEELDTAIISGQVSILSIRDSLTLQMVSDYLSVNYGACGSWETDSKTTLPQIYVLSSFRESQECVFTN